MPLSASRRSVSIETTARLHMGFLDLNGGLGRRFGSIGLSLDQPCLRLEIALSADWSAEGPEAARALRCAQQFAGRLGLDGAARFTIRAAIPEHAGLGSGTQLALAVGVALARLHGRDLSVRDVAALMGRGARSGIGIGAFEFGGLLVDGGRGDHTAAPPLVARMDFPSEWRVLLLLDKTAGGVHGNAEIEAFRALPEFSSQLAAALCRRMLMQALPALAERDLMAFGAAINEIQQQVGEYFAAAQGGDIYSSVAVGGALRWLQSQGVACTGQSSWGPTGFALFASADEAQAMQEKLMLRYHDQPQLALMLCAGRNRGSDIMVDQAAAPTS